MTELAVVEQKMCLVRKVAVQPEVETVLSVFGICASCPVYSCHVVAADDGITTLYTSLDVWGLWCRGYYAKNKEFIVVFFQNPGVRVHATWRGLG